MSGQQHIIEQSSRNPLSRASTLLPEKQLTPTSSYADTQKHLEAPRQSSFLIRLQKIRRAVLSFSMFLPVMLTFAHHRHAIRKPMAEFFGVALLIIFGAGSACQVVLSTNPNVASSARGVSTLSDVFRSWFTKVSQSFLSINFGWAIGMSQPPQNSIRSDIWPLTFFGRYCNGCLGQRWHLWRTH